MKTIFVYLTVLIGAVVGAGFASGRELFLFFVRYGERGFYRNDTCQPFIWCICFFDITVEKYDRQSSLSRNNAIFTLGKGHSHSFFRVFLYNDCSNRRFFLISKWD